MPIVRIPFQGPMNESVDEFTLNQENTARWQNCLINEMGAMVQTPGLITRIQNIGSGAGIDGTYWWDDMGIEVCVSAGKVYQITLTGVNTYAATELTGATLLPGRQVSFAPAATINATTGDISQRYLVMANGDRMVVWDGVTANVLRYMDDILTAADAPKKVSHVGYVDGYLIANVMDGQKFHISELYTPLSWNSLDFYSAEVLPDDLLALYTFWREILLFGRGSIEVWVPNGIAARDSSGAIGPFQIMPGAYVENGINAPNSVCSANGQIFYLNQDRQYCMLNGRTPQPISAAIDTELKSLPGSNTIQAWYIPIGSNPFIMLQWGAADRTYVFNLTTKSWAHWCRTDTSSDTVGRFRGTAYSFAKAWNVHFMGDAFAPTLYELSYASTNHGSPAIFDGSWKTNSANYPMKSVIRTGWIDHGTMFRKQTQALNFRIRQGSSPNSTDVFQYRWRDDYSQGWSGVRSISLKQGNSSGWSPQSGMGEYRVRQYEFLFSSNSPLALAFVEENMIVLDS